MEKVAKLDARRRGIFPPPFQPGDSVIKKYQDSTLEDTPAAWESARHHGVHGGLVHDFLHAVAAQRADADKIYTLSLDDFRGLRLPIEIVVPPSA